MIRQLFWTFIFEFEVIDLVVSALVTDENYYHDYGCHAHNDPHDHSQTYR